MSCNQNVESVPKKQKPDLNLAAFEGVTLGSDALFQTILPHFERSLEVPFCKHVKHHLRLVLVPSCVKAPTLQLEFSFGEKEKV